MRLAALPAAALLLAAACAANEAAPSVPVRAGSKWKTAVPDSRYDTGRGSAVGLNADGEPSLSYLLLQPILKRGQIPPAIVAGEAQPPSVMLASVAEGIWTRTAVTGLPGVGDKTQGNAKGIANEKGQLGPPVNTAVAVDAQGRHHVAWSSTEGAFYANDASGSFGEPEEVTKGSTLGVSVAMGSDGSPWISFYEGNSLMAAHRAGGNWRPEEVAPADVPAVAPRTAIGVSGSDVLLAFGSGDKTHVARQSGGGWTVDTVPGDGGYAVSMAVDGDANPHLAYYDKGGQAFHADKIGDGPWTVTDLDVTAGTTAPSPNWGTGIAVDDSGVHHIVVADPASGGSIGYVTDTSGDFVADVLPNSQGGAGPSIAVSPDGENLAISFFDSVNANVVVAVPGDVELALAFSPPATTAAPTQPPAAQCEPDGTELTVASPVGATASGFDKDCLAVPANEAFTVAFSNDDQVVHNWALYTEDPLANPSAELLGGAADLAPVAPAASETYEVDAIPDAASYFFR
jgi:hypothetical protein